MATPPSSTLKHGFEVVQSYLGQSVPILEGKADTTTITVGMPLFASSGLLRPALGTSTAGDGDDVALVGLAVSNASTASGITRVRYVPFWTGILFSAQMASLLDEIGTPTTPVAATHAFESYGLAKDPGNNIYFIDVDDTTDPLFCVVDFLEPGTVRGRVLVTPNRHSTGLTVWSAT